MSDKHNQDERTKANEDVQTMKSAVYLQIDEGREEIMTWGCWKKRELLLEIDFPRIVLYCPCLQNIKAID